MQAVILAGGKGTRLGKLSLKLPKSLIKIGGKPILEHQILLLKRYGIRDVWILSGYLGKQIKSFCGNGEKWKVKIHHLIEDKPLGTAGALKTLEGKIKDDFLVFSGDVAADFNIESFIKFHHKHRGSTATIIVHSNDHPFDSDLAEVNGENQVTSFLIRPHPKKLLFHNLTIASVFIFSPKIFKYIKKSEKADLERDIFPRILKSNGKIYAYKTAEYIKDVGTIERLKLIRKDWVLGKIKRLNLKNKRAAIFIDRDGVINDADDEIKKTDDFELFPFATKAIKQINQSEYLAVVITNQGVIAKGFITHEELEAIHKKLETELGWQGAKIDGIYFCPHHPEKGFEGEVKELKINCSCRKPKIGLIKRAVKDFNVDLSKSFFIGDSTWDAKTAENAGIKFVGVKTGHGVADGKFKTRISYQIHRNLLHAVNSIL